MEIEVYNIKGEESSDSETEGLHKCEKWIYKIKLLQMVLVIASI